MNNDFLHFFDVCTLEQLPDASDTVNNALLHFFGDGDGSFNIFLFLFFWESVNWDHTSKNDSKFKWGTTDSLRVILFAHLM